MPTPASIVLIEDNPSDVWVLKLAIRDVGLVADIKVVNDGEAAMTYIEQIGSPVPDLFIIDLNLPRVSGHEVLEKLHQSELKRVPILVVTSSDAPSDKERAAAFTPHYFRKPMELEDFLAVGPLIKRLISRTPARLQQEVNSEP